MAMQKDRPEPSWPAQGGRRSGLLIDQGALTPGQKMMQGLGIAAWVALCLVAVFYDLRWSDAWLDRVRASMTMPNLLFRQNGTTVAFFVLPLIAGMLVMVANVRLVTKLTLLALLLATMIGASAVAMRRYVVVMGDDVLIHPALPWHHDVRFALADATVTARGCNLWYSKHSTHHQIIFRVRAPAGDTVDLGAAAGRDLGRWLTVLRDYGNGSLPLPTDARDHAPHDSQCMGYWLDGLGAQQAAEFTRLVG